MNHYAAWKNTLIVFFLFISTLYALPNLYGSDLAIIETVQQDKIVEEEILERSIKQRANQILSGSSITKKIKDLEVGSKLDLETINNELLENNIAFKSLGFQDKNILIRFSDSQSQLSSKALLKEKLSRNYVIALNLAPSVPQWLEGLGGKAMSLGLDLRGGVHFLLEVDMDAVISMSMDRYYNELRTTLRKDKLYKKIRKEDNLLIVSFKSEEFKNQAKKIIKKDLPDLALAQYLQQ